MSVLLEQIGQIAIFLICARTMLHFRAQESYEKYIKLLVSMMLLILLITPIMELFGVNSTEGLEDKINEYEKKLQNLLSEPILEENSIEAILQNITERQVSESAEYVENQTESAKSMNETDMEVSTVVVTEAEQEEVQEEIEKIEINVEKIEIGGNDG